MAKRVFESENIAAVAEKIRELAGTSIQYTSYDLPEGVEEVYASGYAAGQRGAFAFDGEYDAESNKVATVQTVVNKIAEIVADAPEDLDTLKEIATYIASDKTGAAAITATLAQHSNGIDANAKSIQDNAAALAGNQNDINANAAEIASVKKEQATQSANIAQLLQDVVDLGQIKQDTLVFDGTYNSERNRVATVKTVTDKIAEVVANAPGDFDTLKEIADYIASDKTGAAQLVAKTDQNSQAIAEIRAQHETDFNNVNNALDELHTYAQNLVSGGAE